MTNVVIQLILCLLYEIKLVIGMSFFKFVSESFPFIFFFPETAIVMVSFSNKDNPLLSQENKESTTSPSKIGERIFSFATILPLRKPNSIQSEQ